MNAVSAMRSALREARAQIVTNAPGAARGANPEYLHQLRVGARRMRAILRASPRLWRKRDARALRENLRRLAAVSGPARDWDVLMPSVPAALRPRARAHREKAREALRHTLLRLAWALPRALRRPQPPLPEFARETLERLERKLLRRARDRHWSDPQARHALRIRLRRLRYVGEFLEGAFPRSDARPLFRSLKALQDLLGELNDLEVARRLLQELGARERGSARRERALLARLPGAWQGFASVPRFWRKIGP